MPRDIVLGGGVAENIRAQFACRDSGDALYGPYTFYRYPSPGQPLTDGPLGNTDLTRQLFLAPLFQPLDQIIHGPRLAPLIVDVNRPGNGVFASPWLKKNKLGPLLTDA